MPENKTKCEITKDKTLFCKRLKKELDLKKEFILTPSRHILSIPDNDFIKYCPFCGVQLKR